MMWIVSVKACNGLYAEWVSGWVREWVWVVGGCGGLAQGDGQTLQQHNTVGDGPNQFTIQPVQP